ncbi:MAG: rRNA pseudouridine synthase [Firmicutes bacterium]|nr:rRNA pseudouridine synthase [Bacillota bacterium]
MERLQKALAKAGVASRRRAEELILEGRVRVNGEVVTALGTRVEPGVDEIRVDGRVIACHVPRVYLALNKPRGYVTTTRDPQGRPTVLDLIPDVRMRVFPVGRLDSDTEGLLILTNDGDFAYALTHPKHEVPRTYIAWVSGLPAEASLEALRNGVILEDGPTAPADVRVLGRHRRGVVLQLRIHEGRKRQVRRMCKAVGHPVLALRRVAIGPLRLDDLGIDVGGYRFLTPDEVRPLLDVAHAVRAVARDAGIAR